MTTPALSPYSNTAARAWKASAAPGVKRFHESLPGYAPTRLTETPELATELGVARVFVKEESSRFGLPAFKVLGASYAISLALAKRFGEDHALSIPDLQARLTQSGPLELLAATDGNHGRAVAYVARLLGLPVRIFTPAAITAAAKAAIESEGAHRIECDLPYDDVVAKAAEAAQQEGTILIQDTSWPGYERIPQWIVDGYSTLVEEVDAQLATAGVSRLDLVAVPVGVGSLAQAVVRHYRSHPDSPSVLSVEPAAAPAVLASLHAGRQLTVETGQTVMAGLNCGTPTGIGWPLLQAGIDAAVAVSDSAAAQAVHDLAALGVDSGPCGAASLAGVREWLQTAVLPSDATVLLLSTEGRSANPLPDSRSTAG